MNTPVEPKTAEATASPTQLPAVIAERRQEVRVVTDPIPVLDTARFEHMQRIANVMAHSNLVPDALCKTKVGTDMVPLEPQEILSNCFLVVNQAVRWGMDPFAVAQCVSVVHGKLCYEGKLIAAVLDAKIGVDLEYEFSGEGDNMKVVVSAAINGSAVVDSKGRPKTIDGTVGEWKTTGNGSPWAAPGGKKRMLRYRGAREWARVYASGTMLGVYSPDEMEDLSDDSRSSRARDVTTRPSDDETPPTPPPQITQQAQAETAANAATVDQSYVDLVEAGRHDPREDDEPPDPTDTRLGQSRPTGETGPSPAAAASALPAAGEVLLSKDQLITSINKLEKFAFCDPWADEHGTDMEALSDIDRRDVERAFNSKSAALQKAEQKK